MRSRNHRRLLPFLVLLTGSALLLLQKGKPTMKNRLSSIVIAVVMLAIFLAPTRAGAQAGAAKKTVNMNGPTQRLPNAKPDFRGTWARPYTPDLTKSFVNRAGTSKQRAPARPLAP